MNILLSWSKKEHSLAVRLLVMVFAGLLFVFLIPYTLIIPVHRLDSLLHLPSFFFGLSNYIAGGAMILYGLFFGWWSIGIQLFEANGTPLPMMPTQKLLISGPFQYCRNPMTFGTIWAYAGIGVMVGSLAALLAVAFFAGFLITYIKRVEEHELSIRFGQEYLDYKASTPFLFPRFGRRK